MIDHKEAIQVMTPATKPELRFFVFAYWHDARFNSKAGGPMKVYELTSNLTKLGHRVYLFIPKIGYPEKQTTAHVCPVPFIDLPVLRFISFQVLAFLWALRVALSKKYPDIIYVRIMWSFIPMILGRFLSAPVMLEINDSPHRAYASIKNSLKRSVVHFIDKISFYLSDHIFPVTKKIAENMHTLEGVPWKKLTVLPSGTNIDLFHPMDKSQCCMKLGFDESLTYIGFIGTFFEHQGIDILVDAAPEIIKQFPDTYFVLVGDGPMKEALENKIAEMRLNSCFIFTGQVEYKDVPLYLGIMDICVAPLMRKAGSRSPVKVFDYMSCGRPVVVSDVENTGEIFKSSGAVILVQPEDRFELANAINKLLADPEKMKIMGNKGRQFVSSKYDRKKIAKTVGSIAHRLSFHS